MRTYMYILCMQGACLNYYQLEFNYIIIHITIMEKSHSDHSILFEYSIIIKGSYYEQILRYFLMT